MDRTKTILTLGLLTALLLLAACGGDDDSEASPTETTAEETAPEPAPPPEPAPSAPSGDPEVGLDAFNLLGCGVCHTLAAAESTGTIGPNLDESLMGRDAAYVERGIVDPDAEIAQGFTPGVMPPTYGDTVTDEQIAGLVALLTPS